MTGALASPLRSLRLLFADCGWLVGFLVGIGGWGCYVAALHFEFSEDDFNLSRAPRSPLILKPCSSGLAQ